MDRELAYVSCIPQEAQKKVITKCDEEDWERTEYYIGNEMVGIRSFHPCGALELEYAFRNGVKHGWQYRWDHPGLLLSAAPFENGVQHGTAYQWDDDGRLIGSYTMEQGTGLDLWWQDWEDGSVDLQEVHPYVDGLSHGFEWWFCQRDRLSDERHWVRGILHGIEREWNYAGGMSRGYPRYWLQGERVTKRQYIRALELGADAPPFRPEENKPFREFPPEVAQHLRRVTI